MSQPQDTARRMLRVAAGEMATRYGEARFWEGQCQAADFPKWSRARYRRFLALLRLLRALEVA